MNEGSQADNQSEGASVEKIETLTWTASEYIQHEKDSKWYAYLSVGTLVVVVIVYLVTSDILSSIVVLLAFLVLGFYAGRKPEQIKYEISEDGLKVGDKSYAFGQFRSFSVVEEGAINSIWIKPIQRVRPNLVMYYDPQDEQKIKDALGAFLPHEQKQLDAIDRVSKRLRF